MNGLNTRSRVTIWVMGTVIISIIISYIFRKDLGEIKDWFFVIPNVITIELVLYIIFTKFLWKLKKLQPWLVPFPDLSGTWIGILKSSYIDPKTKNRVDSIPCMIVVIHRYNEIHITFVTKESKSYSFSEELKFDKSRNYKQLTYCYANEPKILLNNRSINHKGTAILSLIGIDKLEGIYYSDRETKGELLFNFYCKELLDELPSEYDYHPMKAHKK